MNILEIPLLTETQQLKNINARQLHDEIKEILPRLIGISMDQDGGRNTEINIHFEHSSSDDLSSLKDQVLKIFTSHKPAPVLTVKMALAKAETIEDRLDIIQAVILKNYGTMLL